MRNQSVQSKTFGRLSASGETAAHAAELGADGRPRRQAFLRSGIVLVSVFCLSYALYWSAHVRMRDFDHASMFATLSADEVFGFGSAAMAACRSTESITWDQLSRSVSAEDDGAVSEGISRGFAAFAELKTQIGEEAACSAAIEAFTAREHAR